MTLTLTNRHNQVIIWVLVGFIDFMQKFHLSSCLVLLPCIGFFGIAHADILTKQDDKRIQDSHLQRQVEQQNLPLSSSPIDTPIIESNDNTVSLSVDELKEHPQLIVRALMGSLIQNQADNVAFLLPYYQNLPERQREPIIEHWAAGLVAEQEGKNSQAIHAYKQALAHNEHASLIRLRLAMVLFYDKRFVDAKQSFHKLLDEPDMPDELSALIDAYLQAIQTQERISIQGGGNFLNDKNINNAPSSRDLGGNWVAPEPESAQGISLYLNAHKKWLRPDGFYHEIRLDNNGKYYWNNKPYNEFTSRLSLGIGHANTYHDIKLLPFSEYIFYAGGNKDADNLKHFSQNKGLAVEWQYQFNPQWQSSIYGEVTKQTYYTRPHLNGMARSLSVSAIYLSNAKRYWLVGVDAHRTDARDADDSFIRRSIRAGVGQEFDNGFGARLNVGMAHKDYRGAGFFGKIQHNKEYTLSTSVWNNHWQIFGIMPRLTWSYQKVDSNLPLYQYDKNRVFIEATKRF